MAESLYESLKEQFKRQQLEKNAENLRVMHPEYRRHQRAIETEVADAKEFFAESEHDVFTASLLESAMFFHKEGHGIEPVEREDSTTYRIYRKPESNEEKAERLIKVRDRKEEQYPALKYARLQREKEEREQRGENVEYEEYDDGG